MQTDGDLARRAQGGDEPSFEALLRRYARSAYVTALAIVRVPADADDVVQDSFVRAWRLLDQCTDPDCFAGWLLTTVRRTALNELRRVRTRREVRAMEDTRVTSAAEAAKELERSELRARLLEGMETLSPGQGDVIVLHDVEGLRHAEIALALGISETMSRRHLSDARKRMREHLTREGVLP